MLRKVWRLAAVALVIGALVVPTAAHAQEAPKITVSPPAGTALTEFLFEGTGFAPDAELFEWWVSPDGDLYQYYIDGVPAVIVADANGSFVVSVIPGLDLTGGRPGLWQMGFCLAERAACWSREIPIGDA